MLTLDHLVFAASDLSSGVAWLSARLGVGPSGGGAHPQMGTHNALWRLGEAYLEMIAVDPGGKTPARARWFGLDGATVQAALSGGPGLLHWVARSDDLSADITRARRDPGPVIRVTRDALFWDLTVPDDGALHWGGAYPTLIGWPAEVTQPPAILPDTGLALIRLAARGPTPLGEDLAALGADRVISWTVGEKPRLSATIRRPDGQDVTFEGVI